MWLDVFNEMRKKSGMSLDEISIKSGVPKGTLSKITAGITKAPPLETMRKLVYSMGYTLNDLDQGLEVSDTLSKEERSHIQKYRLLDPEWKEAVDGVLDIGYRMYEKKQAKSAVLREIREQMEVAEEVPAPSEMPTPFYEGGLEDSADELMKYVRRLNPGQQRMILEQAEKMIAARKELAVSSVPQKGGNTPPESDSPTQS